MTNKCIIISQIITLLHVSTLSCHPQGLVINTLPSYTSISNAAVGNTCVTWQVIDYKLPEDNTIVSKHNNNNNNNNSLQLGWYPVAVVILHVYRI